MTRHRHRTVRPRYGRMAVAASSVTVTAVAVLGGVGVLPSAAGRSAAGDRPAAGSPASGPATSSVAGTVDRAWSAPVRRPREPDLGPPADRGEPDGSSAPEALPPDSGAGRRIVYSESRQRVWLVNGDGSVVRTYLVSGSVHDNLDPGSYSVYSRSERAWGIDDSGTMRYFVRFTQGDHAAIGFHDIPVDDGAKVQTVDQLGTPRSHGCIRQRRADAEALWDFAPVGTTVVVTT